MRHRHELRRWAAAVLLDAPPLRRMRHRRELPARSDLRPAGLHLQLADASRLLLGRRGECGASSGLVPGPAPRRFDMNRNVPLPVVAVEVAPPPARGASTVLLDTCSS